MLASLWTVPAAVAAEKSYVVEGVSLRLDDVSDQVAVLYQSMRFNRASNVWNVEVILTNRSDATVSSPLVLQVESGTGTAGLIQPDGWDDRSPPLPYCDLSDRTPNRRLAASTASAPRTLTLGYTAGATPRLTTRVYARRESDAALSLTRTLNEVGQPLPAASIQETGPQSSATLESDPALGLVTLGQGGGAHTWKFEAAGYLPVWRRSTLASGQISSLEPPRLVPRSTHSVAVSSASGGQVRSSDGTLAIQFPPGAFPTDVSVTLTPLTGQTLPAFLPMGWSPLQAFWLELPTDPSTAGALTVQPWGPVLATESAALVRWDAIQFAWVAEAIGPGRGTNAIPFILVRAGAYAIAVGDSSPMAPPAPLVGQPLAPASTLPADLSRLTATGTVEPPSSPASRVAAQVTAAARVVFSSAAGPLPSGLQLHGVVTEEYRLRDGTRRLPPRYENSVVAYQRPGDNHPSTLHATFPMRPQWLFGAEDLVEALVRVEVLAPADPVAQVVAPAGSEITADGIRLLVAQDTFARAQAVELRRLAPTNYSELVAGMSESLVGAFELGMAPTVDDRRVQIQFDGLAPNALFVVARVVSRDGWYGLEPRERFSTDDQGWLTSLEPASGERLPGLTAGGQYLAVRMGAPQGLVSGVARNAQGTAMAGLPVRLQPWLTFSEDGGQFRLLAPAGSAELTVTDPTTGDTGATMVTVVDPGQPLVAQVNTVAAGPRVTGTTPANGATRVTRVTPVTVTFSEPINPGSLGANGVQLLGAGGQPVAASLTLNLQNTSATLLPATPLAPATAHTLLISTNLSDLNGQTLEGPAAFTFTTENETLDRSLAKLTSYEPDENGMAGLVGSPGTAEPEAPVILVNETTGFTATVLSKVDGSFSNSIPADVDDELSAVVVNANGTRNIVTVTRQVFQDGRVGLFEGGGTVDVETPQGTVRVAVESGAIAHKTVFKAEAVSIEEVLTQMNSTPPEEATLIRALRVEIEGDALRQSADVSFAVALEELGLPPGESPTNRAFVILEPIEVEGVPVYHVVDSAQYADGCVTTHSPPFTGLLPSPATSFLLTCAMLPMYAHQTLVVGGVVVAAPESVAHTLSPQQIIDALSPGGSNRQIRRVPGAIVSAYPTSLAGSLVTARPGLVPGAFVAKANSEGHYAVWLRYDSFQTEGVALIARSDRLPNRIGSRGIGVDAGTLGYGVNIVIPVTDTPSGSLDHTAPLISADPPTTSLPVGEPVEVPILLRDDWSRPTLVSVVFDSGHSVATQTGLALPASSVTAPALGTPVDVSATAVRIPVQFRVSEPALASFRVSARDEDGNSRESVVVLRFGGAPPDPGSPIAPHDPTDAVGPQIVSATPQNGVMLPMGEAVTVRFSEAIRQTITDGLGVDLHPPGAAVRVELSPDQQTATILPYNLEPGTAYTLSIGSAVTDLVGNDLDQDPNVAGAQPFALEFRTAPMPPQQLAGVLQPAGTLVLGNYALTLDRNDGALNGSLRVHRLNPDAPTLFTAGLPPYPRAMTLIPSYTFKRRPDRPGSEASVETKALLAVVGGLVGPGTWLGQWIRVFDVGNPEAPQRLVTAYLTPDPTAVASSIKFSGSKLVVHLVTTEGPLLQFINLQALILGGNYTDLDWNSAGNQYFPGVDANGDGDYVDQDEGDLLPRPLEHSVWGLEWALPLYPPALLADFDVAAAGGFVVGAFADRLQVITYQGLPVGFGDPADPTGALIFPSFSPSRVLLDLDFPYRDATGVTRFPVALVAGGGDLHLVKLTDPTAPVLLNRIRLGDAVGSIRSIVRSGPDEYSIGATTGIYVVRRSHLYLPEVSTGVHPSVTHRVNLAAPNRNLGATPLFFASSSGGTRWVLRPPLLSFIQVPTESVANVPSLIRDSAHVRRFLDASVESPFLLPALVEPLSPECPSGLTPPNPELHHYAFVQALGDSGATLRLSVESLDLNGQRVSPKGLPYPPVHLTDHADPLRLSGAQPNVTAVLGHRLSTNPVSELYNLYLAEPIVVVREPMAPTNTAALAHVPGRKAIWSAYHLRLSLDPDSGYAPLADYESTIRSEAFQAGISRTYATLPGEYVDTPNPSLSSSPIVAGVNLQSGEFRTRLTDLVIEGRHQDLLLTRSYESRSRYAGPFGRGWDFNWNLRVFEIPADFPLDLCLEYYGDAAIDKVGHAGDVLLIDGAGSVRHFARIDPADTTRQEPYRRDPAIEAFGWNDKIRTFYSSPPGEFSVLFRFTDGAYVVVSPSGVRTHFLADGRLDRVIGVYEASQLECTYRPNGWLDKITGDRGVSLLIGRYVDSGILDSRSYDSDTDEPVAVGLISRIQVDAPSGYTDSVHYQYDAAGNLVTVEQRSGGVATAQYYYSYDAAAPHALNGLGRAGTGWPSQKIRYADGLVVSVEQDGEVTTFGGAVKTARDRYTSGASVVTATTGGQTASFAVDLRGRPTAFANQAFAADDAGRLTTVSDGEVKSEITYDTGNPVRRFQGNLLATRQTGRPDFLTSFGYDQSAWNRVTNRLSTEGIVTSIAYSGAGTWAREVTETSGSITRTQSFNDHGQMTRESLTEGDHTLDTTYEYDASGLLSAVVRGGEIRTVVDRRSDETAGNLSQGAAGYGLTYNPDGQPETLTPVGAQPSFQFGYRNGLIQTERLQGNSGDVVNTYTYDPADKYRVKTVTEQEAGLPNLVTEYTYDAPGRLQSMKRADEVTSYTYHGAQLTGVRGPGVSRQVTFAGSLPVEVVEQGLTNTLTCDAQDRLATWTAQGLTTAFSYNLGYQVRQKTLTDGSGPLLEESYDYDEAGRVQQIASAAGDRQFTYFADGNLRSLSIDGTLVRDVERDEAGRITKLTLPRQIEILYGYDSGRNQPDAETVRYYPTAGAGIAFVEVAKNYTYDSAGRRQSMSLPVGTWTYAYDDYGYPTSRTDPDSVRVRHTRSPGGALLRTEFEDGSAVDYAYDAARRLQRVGDMEFVLDAGEKLISEIRYPDGTRTRYLSRNGFFEPDQIDHNGLIHNLTWEEGRVVEIRASEALSYTYDGLGRRTRIAFGDHETLFGYDARGHRVAETNRWGSLTTNRVWQASFDNRSRLVSESYPSGLSLDWSPGFNGMPTEAASAGIVSIEWQGPGLIAAVVYEGGLRAVHRYNAALQKESIRYVTGDLEDPIPQAGFDCVLTPAGRVLRETRLHENRTDVYRRAEASAGMRILDYSLSATNTEGEGAEVELSGFTFDTNGEIGFPTNGVGTDARAVMASTIALNYRITAADGIPVLYDAQGAVAQVPVWIRLPGDTQLTRETAHLTYDDFGMLERVVRGTAADQITVTYVRDGLGRIVQRDVAGPPARCRPSSRQYVWRGQQLLEEYESAGGLYQLARRYVYCGPYLLMVQAAAIPGDALANYVPLLNLNGSVCGYAKPDGHVLEMILYGPYGTPVTRRDLGGGQYQEVERSSVANTLLFQGTIYDEETGLCQMGQRNLHPQLGRFLQRDNLLYADSRALFTAFNGDPVGKVDPSGALAQSLEALKGTWEDVKDLGEKSVNFAKAWNATVSLETRQESDLGLAGIDLLTAGLKLASSESGEDFQHLVKQVNGAAENLKTGIEALQVGLDMRRDRLLLTAIKAHALAPAHYSPRMKWLSVGGANAAYDLLDADFFANESLQDARAFRAGSGSATAFYLNHKKTYYDQRTGHLLSLTKKGHALASAYLAHAFKDDSAPGVQTSRQLMEASGAILDLASGFRKVAADKDLSAMTFKIGRGARLATTRNLFKARSHLQLACQTGFKLGQAGILAASDEYTATAYRAAVKQFNDDGGFLTVFSGILTSANSETLDSVAYAIQRYADFNLMNTLSDYTTKLDPRTEFYLRGIDAP